MSQRRRRTGRNTRTTGVIRRSRGTTTAETPLVEHGQSRRNSNVGWRIVSGFIVAVLIGLLALMFTVDAFYVNAISVGGNQYLTKEEIFAFTDVASVHLFWLDTQAIRENILRSPSIADARVTLGWPPDMVQIVVEEREPALVWLQEGVALWVDLQGRMMSQREERPDLIHIVAESSGFGEAIDGTEIPLDLVYGALQLQELLPDLDQLRYNPAKGLGYKNTDGWDIWFGTGQDMPNKVAVYETLSENLKARGIQPGELNLSETEAPVYTVLWGR